MRADHQNTNGTTTYRGRQWWTGYHLLEAFSNDRSSQSNVPSSTCWNTSDVSLSRCHGCKTIRQLGDPALRTGGVVTGTSCQVVHRICWLLTPAVTGCGWCGEGYIGKQEEEEDEEELHVLLVQQEDRTRHRWSEVFSVSLVATKLQRFFSARSRRPGKAKPHSYWRLGLIPGRPI
jgi:hypothetical protein